MSETTRITNLGAPVAVDVAAVEQELRALWKAASMRQGDNAVVRACSCNFVLLARDLSEAESLLPILARISEWHPCRSLIACRESDSLSMPPSAGMKAWISAQCIMPHAGGPQICSEAITIAGPSRGMTDLLNTLVGCLVPDLPVFIYVRSFEDADRQAVQQIARFGNLLIVDSHATKDDPSVRQHLLELLLDPPHGIAVRDLNWARLNAWRDVVAQFFDHPDLRQDAHQISEVEIERDIALAGNIPTRTLLLTGWLASRLGWRLVSTERCGDQWLSKWSSRSGEVKVRFSGCLSGSGDVPGISSIILRSRRGTAFRVVREPGTIHILATASGRGPELVHSVSQDSMDEASLLIRELSLSGRDTSFQSALGEALALERTFK